MTRDLADFAASCGQFPAALQAAQKRGVTKSALHVTRELRTQIRQVTGDMRLSGMRRGGRVGARYDVKGATNPTAMIRGVGPLHLVENPIGAHEIRPRRRGGKKAVAYGGGVYARVEHPGVRRTGGPWRRGVTMAAPDTPRIFQTEVQAAMRRTFT